MSKEITIRAKSLDEAMQYAKTRFGRSAIAVDTRTTRIKSPDGMEIQSVTDLVIDPGFVARPGQPQNSVPSLIDLVGSAGPRPSQVDRVKTEIDRIEHLIRSVGTAEAKLRSFDTGYPLNESLITGGVSDGAIRVLQNSYEEHVPASQHENHESAQLHLLEQLNCAKASSVAGLSGPHAFVGSAGSGAQLPVRRSTQPGAPVRPGAAQASRR